MDVRGSLADFDVTGTGADVAFTAVTGWVIVVVASLVIETGRAGVLALIVDDNNTWVTRSLGVVMSVFITVTFGKIPADLAADWIKSSPEVCVADILTSDITPTLSRWYSCSNSSFIGVIATGSCTASRISATFTVVVAVSGASSVHWRYLHNSCIVSIISASFKASVSCGLLAGVCIWLTDDLNVGQSLRPQNDNESGHVPLSDPLSGVLRP